MRSGSVPNTWLLKFGWNANKLLKLREEVDRRGIDEKDIDAVTKVWDELEDAP
jgi:hypothetical protein